LPGTVTGARGSSRWTTSCPRQYLKEVFAHLRPPPGVSIFYEVKADIKDWEMEILARAGVTQIQPGIEALSTSTLKLMGKGTTSFQNVALSEELPALWHPAGVEPAHRLSPGGRKGL